MDVPSAKRFITSLLESRVEEGRSVSYITSAKKKDEDKLMFTVTRGFDLLLSGVIIIGKVSGRSKAHTAAAFGETWVQDPRNLVPGFL